MVPWGRSYLHLSWCCYRNMVDCLLEISSGLGLSLDGSWGRGNRTASLTIIRFVLEIPTRNHLFSLSPELSHQFFIVPFPITSHFWFQCKSVLFQACIRHLFVWFFHRDCVTTLDLKVTDNLHSTYLNYQRFSYQLSFVMHVMLHTHLPDHVHLSLLFMGKYCDSSSVLNEWPLIFVVLYKSCQICLTIWNRNVNVDRIEYFMHVYL